MIALALSLALAAQAPVLVDRVAAVVNGDTVTLSELVQRAGPAWQRALAEPAGPARQKAQARALKEAFDNLLADKLMETQITTLGIEISDAELDQAIADIKQRNNLTDAQLWAATREQGYATPADFKVFLKKELSAYKLMQLKVKSRVKVTDEDVKNYYQTHPELYRAEDEVHVRHIFVAIPAHATADQEKAAKEKIDAALKRVKAGESFSKVAKEMSEGPSASDGGDLGWRKKGFFSAELEKEAFSLKPGEVSPVIKNQYGYQVLEVEGRKSGGQKALADVQEQIRDQLSNEQVETFRDEYVTELKKDAVIDVKIPELADAANVPAAKTE